MAVFTQNHVAAQEQNISTVGEKVTPSGGLSSCKGISVRWSGFDRDFWWIALNFARQSEQKVCITYRGVADNLRDVMRRENGDPYGNRTRVSAVKGPRPNR